MRPGSSKSILVGIVVIQAVGAFYASAAQPVAARQSAVKQLGQESDFEKIGEVLLPNLGGWGEIGKDGQASYRKLKAKSEADLRFAAFGVDSSGFCKRSMILDIFYRDDLKRQLINENRAKGQPVIQSRIDFSKDNEYVEVGHLGAEADGKWKLARTFLERTPRQMVRAIEGSFQFRIVMPKSGSVDLPISYVRLSLLEQEEFEKIREKDRAERGLQRVDYKPEGGLAGVAKGSESKGFAIYPVNYLKLVFPNSAVDYSRVGDALRCFEVTGQAEPLSFVVHAFERLSEVKVKVSDLHFGINTIPTDMVDIRRVICNDQRWGWGWTRRYGLCPDYLSFTNDSTDIEAGTSCQFWLTVNIPEDAAPGLYAGEVSVSSEEKSSYQAPLSVEVLPVRLLENKVGHLVYHSPFYRDYHRSRVSVLRDMESHGLTPMFFPKGQLTRTQAGDVTIQLDGFEQELQAFRKVYPQAKMIFITVSDFSLVWLKLNGPKPPFEHQFPQYEQTYGRILKKYADVARNLSLEPVFAFVDEPGLDPYKRRVMYLCSSIARRAGLKTWSGVYPYADKQLPLSAEEERRGVNYLRPMSEVLDISVCPARLLDESFLAKAGLSGITAAYVDTYSCTSVRPVYNRVLKGLYPFAVDATYVFTYAYRDDLADPYDDMDVQAEHSNVVGMNDYLLTYPTWKGDILPTLCYESLREGTEDSQLISTLQILIDQAMQGADVGTKHLGKEAEAYLDGILKRMSKNFAQNYWAKHRDLPVDPMEKAILRDLNNGQSEDYEIFDQIRRGICDRIIKLQTGLLESKARTGE